MAKNNKKTETETQATEPIYSASSLANSKTMQEYGLNRDFLRAILGEDCQTMSEARKKIESYISSFNKSEV